MPSPPDRKQHHSTGADLDPARARAYWRANLVVMVPLLVLWFAVSFGCGILFKDELDRFHAPGTDLPLGFWFAQVGSIYGFVLLIFAYVGIMNRLDRRFGVREE